MIFLTEEDVRQRCELGQGGEFCLQAGERLTPAATELLRSRNCRVILPGVRMCVYCDYCVTSVQKLCSCYEPYFILIKCVHISI